MNISKKVVSIALLVVAAGCFIVTGFCYITTGIQAGPGIGLTTIGIVALIAGTSLRS